jgi:4-alpha-glucanotransferase
LLHELCGDRQGLIRPFLDDIGGRQYALKAAFDTQQKITRYFEGLEQTEEHDYVCAILLDLSANLLLFEVEGSSGAGFHFRFNMHHTASFRALDATTQSKLYDLYVDYFFRRQDKHWQEEAMKKLPALKQSTNMLICGEDLGLVPTCVPEVMRQLGILSLEIQRMPKALGKEFFHPNEAPYLSVVTPSRMI